MLNMVMINITFNNFSEIPIIHDVFSEIVNEYKYAENEILSILIHHLKLKSIELAIPKIISVLR